MGAVDYRYRELNITPDIQRELILLTIRGVTLRKIIDKFGFDEHAFMEYRQRYPLFDKQFTEARAEAADYLSDDLLTATDGCVTKEDAMIARVRVDALRSVVAWRNPQRYGNRVDVNVQHTIDLSAVLAAADSRVIPVLQARNELVQPLPNPSTQPRSFVIGHPRASIFDDDEILEGELVKRSSQELQESHTTSEVSSADTSHNHNVASAVFETAATSETGERFEDLL